VAANTKLGVKDTTMLQLKKDASMNARSWR